ncbi:MAG: TasA family protein [Christensenellales bacterium]
MSRRIIAVAAVIILAAVGIVGGTLAWFTDKETANNQLNTGKIDVELYENGVKVDGGGITVNDFMPGDKEAKKVKVRAAQGSGEAWIRAKVEFDWGDAVLNANPKVVINYNTRDWEKIGDWFYYKWTIKPGGPRLSEADDAIEAFAYSEFNWNQPNSETSHLFDKVELSKDAGNEYASKPLKIKITVQAVQADNNRPKYLKDIEGWPNP